MEIWYTYRIKDRCVKIGEAAQILGVHAQTVLRWAEGGLIHPAKRTLKGTHPYSLQELLGVRDVTYPTLAYARVSRSYPKEDLDRQHALLEAFCHKNSWQTEIIRDFGSGMNDNKKGFLRRLALIVRGS